MARTLKDLRKENPYPEDIFIEPSKEQWKRLAELCEQTDKVLDGYAGSISRHVWNICCDKMEEIVDDRIVEIEAEKDEINKYLDSCYRAYEKGGKGGELRKLDEKIDELIRLKGEGE